MAALTDLLAPFLLLNFDVAKAFKLCHVANCTTSHKKVLKASIRGSQRLAWDDSTYYGDSINQLICKLQIPHQTRAICSNKSLWTR